MKLTEYFKGISQPKSDDKDKLLYINEELYKSFREGRIEYKELDHNYPMDDNWINFPYKKQVDFLR